MRLNPWDHQKEDVIKQIDILESLIGKKTFNKKYRQFFIQVEGPPNLRHLFYIFS